MDRQWRRPIAYALLGLLPWSVVVAPNATTLVFAGGLVSPSPLYITDLFSYLFVHTRGLPAFLLAWPIGVGMYALALFSALSGTVWNREDRRLTGGLLVVVGLTQLTLALGLSRRLGTVALPVGTGVFWGAAWWFEWPVVRPR